MEKKEKYNKSYPLHYQMPMLNSIISFMRNTIITLHDQMPYAKLFSFVSFKPSDFQRERDLINPEFGQRGK